MFIIINNMLEYINLVLIFLLTCSLVISLILFKKNYEKDIQEQDDMLVKLFNQINKNDDFLKSSDLKNKEKLEEIITKNTNDLGENKGFMVENRKFLFENTGLIDGVVTRLDTTEKFEDLTYDDIKNKQSNIFKKILSMKLLGQEKPTTDSTTDSTPNLNPNSNQQDIDCVETVLPRSNCTSIGQELYSITTEPSGNGMKCTGESTLCVAGDGNIPRDTDCVETVLPRSNCTSIGQELYSITTEPSGNGIKCTGESTLCVAGDVY